MASAVLLDKSHTETVDIGTFNSIEIKVAGEAHPVGKWVTFTSRGYVTIEEARLRGQNFSDLLSIAGCLGKLGVDVGFNKSTLQFSEQIAANVHAKTGKRLVGEVHGLLTYESDTVAIVGMDAHLNSQTPIPALLELVRPYIGVSRSLHVRQSTCAKLLNDSFFVGSSDAQFILRMTAIEVLCEKVDHNEKHRKAIDQLIDHLDTLDIELESKADLAKTLGHAKSNGIRTSIRSACKRLLSQTETDRVLKLYDLRSEFVHYGHNRGQFAAESGEALELATKLLKSDLENSSAPI